MPVTAIIRMKSLGDGAAPRSFHALFHSVLFDRITAANPNLGSSIHDSNLMAPFSLSPVMGRLFDKRTVRRDEIYTIRVGILHAELEQVFFETLERGLWKDPLDLAGLPFQVEEITLGEKEGEPWSGKADYAQLLERSTGSTRIRLQLASPMAFRRGGLHYPLPDPCMVFANLTRRWNLFSPVKLPEKPSCDNVSFTSFNLCTKPFALRKGGTVFGAVGRVTFILRGKEKERRNYESLLRFAFFSGIGVKTGQGMGMCRIEDMNDSA